MEKNISDNTLVFGSCHARSCIEVPSLKAGNAKWKAFYKKFPWLKGQSFYLRRSCFWNGKERILLKILTIPIIWVIKGYTPNYDDEEDWLFYKVGDYFERKLVEK